MRRSTVLLAAGGFAALAMGPRAASAQGFGVFEHGTCVMGRAGTGVASPCNDGSTIYFNPAGLALARNQVVSAGGTLIAPSGGFTNDVTGVKTDLNDRIYPVPHAYYARPFGERLVGGIGVFVPYGLETDWPESFEGRFLGYKSLVQGIYIQPTLAARVMDGVMIGAGLDLTYLRVGLHQHLDLSSVALPPPAPPGATFANLGVPAGTDFANADLEGSAWNLGGNFGILVQPTRRLSLGFRFLTRQRITVDDADVTFTQLPTGITLAQGNPFGVPPGTPLDAVLAPRFLDDSLLSAQNGATTIRLPEQLVVGVAYDLTEQIKVLFDYQYTNWEVFDQLVLDFERAGQRVLVENYSGTNGFRIGGEYAWKPSTTFRAGFLWHDAAAPPETVTPNLPEGKRTELTLGLGTSLRPGLRLDLAYQYIDQADRRGRTTDGGLAVPTAAVNNGLYTFKAHLFGATLALAF